MKMTEHIRMLQNPYQILNITLPSDHVHQIQQMKQHNQTNVSHTRTSATWTIPTRIIHIQNHCHPGQFSPSKFPPKTL